MNCLNPIAIYTSVDYEQDKSICKLFLPCGKCEACRNSDSLQWRIRLKEEFYNSENAFFVTLTYDDTRLHYKRCSVDGKEFGIHPVVCLQDIQKFFKRLRKRFEFYYKSNQKKFKYFLVSEYGPTTFRPHYHALLFNLPCLSPIKEIQDSKITKAITEIWDNGNCKIDRCNENRIGYCTKYMSCYTIIPPYLPKPFRVMSRGLGKAYLENNSRISWHKNNLNNFYPVGNKKLKLPRYYKDKIFSDDEKEMIYQLNKDRIEKEEKFKKHKYGNRKDFKDFSTSVEKFKRDYKNKSLKNRKDI